MGAADTVRYNSMGVTAGFLVFSTSVLCFRRHHTPQEPPKGYQWLAPVAITLLNTGSTIALFDYYTVQSFPYSQHAKHLIRMLTGLEPFPPRPAADWYPPASEI